MNAKGGTYRTYPSPLRRASFFDPREKPSSQLLVHVVPQPPTLRRLSAPSAHKTVPGPTLLTLSGGLRALSPEAWIDEPVVSTGRVRPKVPTEEFVRAAVSLIGVDYCLMAGVGLSRQISRLRTLLVTVGVERWNQGPRELGRLLGRRADVISRWVRWGSTRRRCDPDFARAYDDLDRELSTEFGGDQTQVSKVSALAPYLAPCLNRGSPARPIRASQLGDPDEEC